MFLPVENCPVKAAGLLDGRNPRCLSPKVPIFQGIVRENEVSSSGGQIP